MKIICMDCQNETHLEVEMLKDKKKMTCARCEEKSQAATGLDLWVAPPEFQGTNEPDPAADYAYEIIQPPAYEADVLEIPEAEPAAGVAASGEMEDVILYETGFSTAAEEPPAAPIAELPGAPIVSGADDFAEPAAVELGPLDFTPPRQEPAPIKSAEADTPAEPPAQGKVKLLRFSTAGLFAGLTVFLAFIFLGDTFLGSPGDINHVAAAPRQAKDSDHALKKSAVVEATPAPQPSATPAPTPEPTPEATPAPTPAPEPLQAETTTPPAETSGAEAAGRFAVQVGSYNEVGQANERAEKLRAAGFNPRVVSVELPKRGTWYRVVLGSFSDRAEASRYGAELRSKGAAQDFVIAGL